MSEKFEAARSGTFNPSQDETLFPSQKTQIDASDAVGGENDLAVYIIYVNL